MTITEKRAKLFKEWTLATLANDERYYLQTLALGIPDGTTSEDAFYDIEHGEYDEDIDDMIFCTKNPAGFTVEMVISLTAIFHYQAMPIING